MTKLENFCIKWLNKNYNHMEPFIIKEYPDYIFHMKDGKCILQYNKKNGYVYVSYKEIWKFFESYFCMSNEQIKDITKIWVEEHYKVGVKPTFRSFVSSPVVVEEHYKVGVKSTLPQQRFPPTQIEKQYKVGVKSTQEFGWRLQKEVDEQYKMGITSTMVDYKEITNQAEEQYKLQTNIK